MFHSARWNHGVDINGKRIAVIGTGASAIQIIPQMQKIASHLKVFQRTPAWIMPKADRPMRAIETALFKRAPQLQTLYRDAIYWRNELYATGFVVDPRLMKGGEFVANLYRKRMVKDPVLRAKLTPNYTMGCKRTLLSNEYYPAMCSPNVGLVTTGIDRITDKGIRTRDGIEHEVDAIILATGFMTTDYLSKLNLVGRGGINQNELLAAKPEHYKGITVRGFPNMFLLMGPNTGLGHNSMVFMIEAQVRYVTKCIEAILDRNLKFLDVKESVQHAYTVRIQDKLQKSVWNSGCQSWYLDKNGRNMAAWPGYTWQYWLETRQVSLSDFEQVAHKVKMASPAFA
jgi:cation diffusion facilitator CzcD-associated flavoprotein CzcO